MRRQLHSPIVARHRLAIAAKPAKHNPKQIERRNMFGLRPNNRLQQALGLTQIASF